MQELRCLRRCPDRHSGAFACALPVLDTRRCPYDRAGPTGPRQFSAAGRVVGDQPAAHRGVQRRPQRGPDPVERRGRNRRPERLMLADDRGEHRLHVRGRQLSQQHVPDIRGQVQAHVRGVAPHGRRGRRGAGDQPVRQPVPYGQDPAAAIAPPRAVQSGEHGCRCRARRVAAAADPAPHPPGVIGSSRPMYQLP